MNREQFDKIGRVLAAAQHQDRIRLWLAAAQHQDRIRLWPWYGRLIHYIFASWRCPACRLWKYGTE